MCVCAWTYPPPRTPWTPGPHRGGLPAPWTPGLPAPPDPPGLRGGLPAPPDLPLSYIYTPHGVALATPVRSKELNPSRFGNRGRGRTPPPLNPGGTHQPRFTGVPKVCPPLRPTRPPGPKARGSSYPGSSYPCVPRFTRVIITGARGHHNRGPTCWFLLMFSFDVFVVCFLGHGHKFCNVASKTHHHVCVGPRCTVLFIISHHVLSCLHYCVGCCVYGRCVEQCF